MCVCVRGFLYACIYGYTHVCIYIYTQIYTHIISYFSLTDTHVYIKPHSLLLSYMAEKCGSLIITTYDSLSDSTIGASAPFSTSTGMTSLPILESLNSQTSPASRPCC